MNTSSSHLFTLSARKDTLQNQSQDSPARSSSSRFLNRSQRVRGSPSTERQMVSSLKNQLQILERKNMDLEDRLASLRNQNLSVDSSFFIGFFKYDVNGRETDGRPCILNQYIFYMLYSLKISLVNQERH